MTPTRLLMISYLFPPVGGVGVQRALSLAKYLPECGFDVHVLRARNAAAPVYDPGLLRQLPPGVTVHDAFTPELPFAFRQALWRRMSGGRRAAPAGRSAPARRSWKRLPADLARRILCPEPEVLWVPFALRQARRIVRRHGIEAVMVTVPPFSAFLVGNALKREFPHLKLIADFRDDWLRFYLGEFEYQKSDYTRRRAAAIERQTVELADAAVVVTRSMQRDIAARYPDLPSHKFVFIPNGYDPQSFPAVEPGKPAGSRVVVSHIGTVYSASSARYYLSALDRLPADLRQTVETRFIGRIADDEKAYLGGRASEIKQLGFMPQAEALGHMAETDYLLLTMTDAASLTGKIFEYLAAGKPILAIAPKDGEVARVLQETGGGWCADPHDEAAIQQLLRQAVERKRNGENGFHPDPEAIRRYERPRLAAQYGRLIRGL